MESTSKNDLNKLTPDDFASETHIGLIREVNEDSYGYVINPSMINHLAIVADGIGGHERGEIASRTCVKTVLTEWRNNEIGKQKSKTKLEKFIHHGIVKSNKDIFGLNNAYNLQHPMGTTVVIAILIPGSILLAHAGDSRCYRVRDGVIERLTEDHSFVAELIRKNVISEEEAVNHPFAHIISKSVGPAPDVEPEINSFKRIAGDRFLLCSDGLTNHVNDKKLEEFISKAISPNEASRKMLNSALHAGGEDNITLITIFT